MKSLSLAFLNARDIKCELSKIHFLLTSFLDRYRWLPFHHFRKRHHLVLTSIKPHLCCHERNWTHLNSALLNSLLPFFDHCQEAVINYSLEEVSNWQVCQIFKAIYFGVYQQIFFLHCHLGACWHSLNKSFKHFPY